MKTPDVITQIEEAIDDYEYNHFDLMDDYLLELSIDIPEW